MVTLGGVLGEQAPTDPGAFVEYAATLAAPDLHELVRDREPLSEPVLMRYPTGRRRRYDRLDRFPGGLVVVGDALCSFNPVYGQGMTVAAAQAVALATCLDDGTDEIGARLFGATAEVVGDAWDLAASRDARHLPDPASPPSLPRRLIDRYQRRLLEVAVHDPEVSRAFREVMAMVSRPPALLRPRVAARVLTAGWRHRNPADDVPDPSLAPAATK
jgi:2-polyprenyl-6-methoxyphenol hydroxylase-like FAD-dependent oxidoreductase